MNTVKRFSFPDGTPRYEVTDSWGCASFLDPQLAADYIANEHPGETYRWDTRDPQWLAEEEQREINRHEQAKHDAREDARLEREEE